MPTQTAEICLVVYSEAVNFHKCQFKRFMHQAIGGLSLVTHLMTPKILQPSITSSMTNQGNLLMAIIANAKHILKVLCKIFCGFVLKKRSQTKVFEVFNVKVKLLHDSSSYQTIPQQRLFFPVIANAISSFCNYRKGAAKKQSQSQQKRKERRGKRK